MSWIPFSQKLLKRISSFCGGFLSAAYSALPLFLKRRTSPYFLVLTPLKQGRQECAAAVVGSVCSLVEYAKHILCPHPSPPPPRAAACVRMLEGHPTQRNSSDLWLRAQLVIEAIPGCPTLLHIFEDFNPPCPAELWS